MKLARRTGPLALSATLLLIAAACARESARPTAPVPVRVGPLAESPEEALFLLQWSWENRNITGVRQVVANDFTFGFSAGDSAGIAYRERPWSRADEIASCTHLFEGGGTLDPATRISLWFDPTLRSRPDPRPGRDPRWHRVIETEYTVEALAGFRVDIVGRAVFYFVRGDSAAIPADPEAVAPGPDASRWWLERWEDHSLQEYDGIPNSKTWGYWKALYR